MLETTGQTRCCLLRTTPICCKPAKLGQAPAVVSSARKQPLQRAVLGKRAFRSSLLACAGMSAAGPVLTLGKPGEADDAKIGCGVAAWFPDDAVYRMWYYANSKAQAEKGDVPKFLSLGQILLAESKNFVDWEKKGPVLSFGEAQDYDSGGLGLTSIGTIGGEIWMPIFAMEKLAQGEFGKQRIGLTKSKDGVNWTKIRGPGVGGCVLEGSDEPESWESMQLFCPGFAQLPDGTFILYYHTSKTKEKDGVKRAFWTIAFATSQDGLNFRKGGPIRWTHDVAEMDYGGNSGPAVIPNPFANGYLMAYTAIHKDLLPSGFYGRWTVGLATSHDGISWTRVGDQPVLEGQAGSWDEGGAGHPSLCLGPDGLLRMLYHGFPNKGLGGAILEEEGNLTEWRRL